MRRLRSVEVNVRASGVVRAGVQSVDRLAMSRDPSLLLNVAGSRM